MSTATVEQLEIDLTTRPQCEWENCQAPADYTIISYCHCQQLICTLHWILFKVTADQPVLRETDYTCPQCGTPITVQHGLSFYQQLIDQVIPL